VQKWYILISYFLLLISLCNETISLSKKIEAIYKTKQQYPTIAAIQHIEKNK
jgi:hypothetical protein